MHKLYIISAAIFLCMTSYCLAAEKKLSKAEECRSRGGLANTKDKLENGGKLNIAYLGGSITCQKGYRIYSLDWFRKNGKAEIKEIFAGIGGTPSFLGVYRLRQDVLRHNPDLLFVEFAVNDGGTRSEEIIKSMEGIVRQTWRASPGTDICFVYTLSKPVFNVIQSGRLQRSAAAMELVAEHYGIPSIHMGIEIARLEKEGKLVIQGPRIKKGEDGLAAQPIVFSKDGTHPYVETGHKLYMRALERSFAKILSVGEPGPHKLLAPLRKDNRENCTIVSIDPSMLSEGWTLLDASKDSVAKKMKLFMPKLYLAEKPGESIKFRFKGKAIGFYDVLGPDCGRLAITLDCKPLRQLNRFDGYCTYYRLSNFSIAGGLVDKEHTVEVKILAQQPDREKIFAKHHSKRNLERYKKNPERFDGTKWYIGGIMIEGKIVGKYMH